MDKRVKMAKYDNFRKFWNAPHEPAVSSAGKEAGLVWRRRVRYFS